MHEANIIHRDIKLENILIDVNKDGSVQLYLADFGFSTYLAEGNKLTKGMGSKYYIAPEVYGRLPYDKKVDVWSASVIVYVIICGHLPYPGENFTEIYKNIKTTDLDKRINMMNLGLSQGA